MSDLCVRHLLREHREIEKVLSVLESLLKQQAKELQWGQAEREDFKWISEVLGNHLNHHVRKEDEVLFPALEAFLPRDLGPLAVLRAEHADLRDIFDRLVRAGESRLKGNDQPEVIEGFKRYGGAILQIVRDHIYKEDRVLFPMVARFLSPERDAHLREQMEAINASRAAGGPAS